MNVLKRLYDKSAIWFAVLWIIAYCVLLSAGDALSALIGVDKSVTLAIGLLLSAILLLFLKKNGLFADYGLCAPKTSAGSMLYYIPILVMLTANLWYGVTVNYGALETVLYILAMLCVGFLEEVIFRGLLFEAMRKDSVKAAIIVSMITEYVLMRSHIMMFLILLVMSLICLNFILSAFFLSMIIVFIFGGKKHNDKINIIRKHYHEEEEKEREAEKKFEASVSS